jgi:hypothetical protein
MLIACGFVLVIQVMTIRKNNITTAHLMSLQLPFVDMIESAGVFVLLFVAIGMFCFRNNEILEINSLSYLSLFWYLLCVAFCAFSYVRDGWKARETTMQVTEEERADEEDKARRQPMKSSSRGVSTRTLARRWTIALGRLDVGRKGTRTASAEHKTRMSADDEGGPSFDINPGLM